MNVMGYLMAKNEPLATPDVTQDPRFAGLRNYDTRVRAVLAVALKVENRFTGMLAVTHARPGREWLSAEIQLLTIVAGNSAAVIEQARLREATREAERIQRELSLAREIQMNLVPSRPLTLGSWQIMGRVVPAREIGGDAFDYFLLGPDRAGFAIADVVGKGVPAALLMSNVQASLRAFCDGRNRIPDALRLINQSVSRHTTGGKFITFFYAELDAERGRLFYSNAGHNYPLLRHADGTLIELRDGGLPLGILEDSQYLMGEHAFTAGDSLLLFSDGISEALDLRRDEYGDERLRQFWSERGGLPPSDMVDALLADVQAFRGRADQSDDMTVVVVGKTSGA
jgi:sigma-B regulation protein RsbU (phosphoserine phosphatase)